MEPYCHSGLVYDDFSQPCSYKGAVEIKCTSSDIFKYLIKCLISGASFTMTLIVVAEMPRALNIAVVIRGQANDKNIFADCEGGFARVYGITLDTPMTVRTLKSPFLRVSDQR